MEGGDKERDKPDLLRQVYVKTLQEARRPQDAPEACGTMPNLPRRAESTGKSCQCRRCSIREDCPRRGQSAPAGKLQRNCQVT